MYKSFVVYLHKSPSGKYYVWITSQPPQVRWKMELAIKSNQNMGGNNLTT